MAQAIYAEAGGESFDGKRAVGHVINNRVKKHGKNPCIIIKQPGQFVYRTGKGKRWEESLRAARNLGNDLTSGAMYFKALRSRVKWNYKLTVRIGGHLFYK
jgi:spore germination cell wall hydrolase CwlJ-like protein